MGTFGAQRLRRSSISSSRARRALKAIETYFGRTIGGDSSDHQTSEKISSKQTVVNDNERSMDKTKRR